MSSSAPCCRTSPGLCSSLHVRDQVSHRYKTTGKITVTCLRTGGKNNFELDRFGGGKKQRPVPLCGWLRGVTERNYGTGGWELKTESSEVKVDRFSCIPWKTQRYRCPSVRDKSVWVGGTAALVLNLGTRWRRVVSFRPPPPYRRGQGIR
jgi:hypothetical protein